MEKLARVQQQACPTALDGLISRARVHPRADGLLSRRARAKLVLQIVGFVEGTGRDDGSAPGHTIPAKIRGQTLKAVQMRPYGGMDIPPNLT